MFFSFLFLFILFLLYFILFIKRIHIQVFKKRMHEVRIRCFFVYKQIQIPCSFFESFVCSDIHITKYIQINT